MRKILDKLFENKKLAFGLPILFAALVYLLFVLFGTAEDKNELLIVTPIVTVIWFLFTFLGIFFQVKNSRCPEWFLNFIELLLTLVFVGFSVIDACSFIITGFQNYDPVICAGIVTYSSISLAHNKRVKIKN
jgi:hypothetical protein